MLNLATIIEQSAARYPTRTALVIGDHRLPYPALRAQARAFAGALRELGLRRGEHIALLLPSVPQFTIAYFGAHYAGNPVVPLNPMLKPDELAHLLADADAAALVVWEDWLAGARVAQQRAAGLRQLIVVRRAPGPEPEGARCYDALLARAAPLGAMAPTAADDTAVIMYTSGTTGSPKGAELTHLNVLLNAWAVSREEAPVPPGEGIVLSTLPLFHGFGQTVLQNMILMWGGTLVLQPAFDLLGAAELIEQHGVNSISGVPPMYGGFWRHPAITPDRLKSLRHCMSGGAPMPPAIRQGFSEKFGVAIGEGYGLTECAPVASMSQTDPGRPGGIGRPIWGVELKLVDPQGQDVTDDDAPGELYIRGHNVMKGYYKRPEQTAEVIVDGWLRSGDICARAADGAFYLIDRRTDLIIRNGYNVYPSEVERALLGHPAVASAAVVGVPHAAHGEEIKAFVALRPGAAVEASGLIAHCKERLAEYKYPRMVEIRAELPVSPTGKVIKRDLTAPPG